MGKVFKFLAVAIAVIMVLIAMLGGGVLAAEQGAENEAGVGDGDFSYVENSETERSDETNCQLTVVMECPDGFGLNSYVVLTDEDGQMYRVSVSSENGYRDRIYLRPGKYTVIEARVFDDNTGRYPFEQVRGDMEISLDDGDAQEIGFRLKDYDALEATIASEIGENEVLYEVSTVQESLYETALDGIMVSSLGELYYPVENKGSGIGGLAISGNAKGNYDVVIEIIKSGVIGEARFSLSLDGGKSLIGDDVTAERFELRDYGLVLYFTTENDSDELQKGDVFTAEIPETFSVMTSKYGDANVILTGSPEDDYDMELAILSSGGRESAKFTVSLDAGNSVFTTDTIPEDGIYELPDNMRLCFSDSEDYVKGVEFSAEIRSNVEAVSLIPLYVLAGIVFTAGMAFYLYLISNREREQDYVLHKWRDRQEPETYE